MRGFIRFCINRPVLTWCFVAIFVMLGFFSYDRLGVTLFPEVFAPMAVVRTVYVGASPEEIESLVSKPLEDALADLDGLKSMTSYSQSGVSLVSLEFDEGTDIDLRIIDVENKIRSARGELPDGAEESVTSKLSLASMTPFLVASFTSGLPEVALKKIVDDGIKPIISRVGGVGQVETRGGLDREILVILDPAALSEHKISYQDICAHIAANSTTRPAGYIAQAGGRTTLRMIGAFEDLEAISNMPIPTGAETAPLSVFGDVVDGAADRESLARLDGKAVVQLVITGRANADIVKAGAKIKSEIERLLSEFQDISVTYTLDDTAFIEGAVKNVIWSTCLGIALTAVVIYLFLGQLSATFLVAVAMPVAFVSTFLPIWLHGFSLNLMTTLGLGLSMGVLVDNSILVLENIYRFRDMGYAPFEAAELGTSEISASVLAGVLTNLGVFLPVTMLSGPPGQFLKPFGITILYATLFSLWVTMSVIPSAAARLISSAPGASNESVRFSIGKILTGWWTWLYDGLKDLFLLTLRESLRHPVVTLIFFAALTGSAFILGSGIAQDSLPSSEEGNIVISLKFSNNFSLEATAERTKSVENFINSLPEAPFIEHVVSAIGSSEFDQSQFKSEISVYLKDAADRPETTEVARKIRAYLDTESGIEYTVLSARPALGGPDPIEVRIKGEDFSVLLELAETIRWRGLGLPGVADLSLSTEMGAPELRIQPIRSRLVRLGMDIDDLTLVVRGYLNGERAGVFREGGAEHDIKARLDFGRTDDIYAVGALPVTTNFGAIPLDEMADVVWADSPTEIRRIERERAVVITGNAQDVPLGDVIEGFRALLGEIELPPGYSAHLAGEADDMEEDSRMMGQTIILAALVTFFVIASILESFVLALIILLAVPMSAIGVVPLMMATGASMSIIAMIGLVMLVGIVVNNAIVVVDYAELLRRGEGLAPSLAIARACDVRFKSIVMGLVTSVVSFMPLALATGRGSEFRWPIAIVAIGGLIAGGLLALLAVPAAYDIYWAIRSKFLRLRRGRKQK
ncbi:MAG: efflux RND transporter permease subunit [Synergistaceae bacterium]|jgi:HAE1 family hydrophobic/amphiphilic exporter-1|nr:efflux RND transporter permease subunit [Synergistaceae bacterium]